jgi:hypothetical protein
MNNRDPFSLRPSARTSNASPISLLQRNPSSSSGLRNTSAGSQQHQSTSTTSGTAAASAATTVPTGPPGSGSVGGVGVGGVAGGSASGPGAPTHPNHPDNMGFEVPRNVPSFDAPQRAMEDHVWGGSGRSRFPQQDGGVGAYAEKLGSAVFGEGNSGGRDLPMYKDKPYYAQRRRRGLEKYRPLLLLVGVVALLMWFLGFFSSSGTTSSERPSSSWFSSGGKSTKTGQAVWDERKDMVRDVFQRSWEGYEKYAWGKSCLGWDRGLAWYADGKQATTSTTPNPTRADRWFLAAWVGSSLMHSIH